ncbi:MAG TPA: PhnD/SsuA/transferrin family substrate-binding protein [Patescibacteria group bacterium]|nr:PhnD/SsuA/transferrin family substrate-binding protein [Patescibacteria group bacterium]
MIASARMYAWSPSLAAAWQRLLEWIATAAGVELAVIDQSTPTNLDELWARPDMGCVFMCGYPWALRRDRPALLAAPVPSPPRYGGRPVYVTDFIVSAAGPHRTLAHTFGGVIAYSTEHSHSGYNAPRHHLLEHVSRERPALYRAVLGPYVRQRPLIDLVLKGEADVAAIDGYALDLLGRHDPALAARVRVVETTAPAPSPPLVASSGIDAGTRERIAHALATAHHAAEARPLLDDVLLTRFDRVRPADFEVFLQREQAAKDAGYPKLA